MNLIISILTFVHLSATAPETLLPPQPSHFYSEAGYAQAQRLYVTCGNWATNDDGSHNCFDGKRHTFSWWSDIQ